MANKDYVIKVSLDGDASGLSPLEDGLAAIEKKAESMGKVSINAEVTGSALDTLKDIETKLSSLDDRNISINVSGSVESSLKSIEGHLDKISENITTKIDTKGNAEKELENIQGLKDRLEKPITIKIDANDSAFKNLLNSLNAIESRIGSVDNDLKNLKAPDDIGMHQLAEDMNSISNRIGSLQKELNSLDAPDLTPRMNTPDLSNYYASFDSMGNMSMGSLGGTSILSMMGLNSVKSLTWGNAVADQMNDQLLLKMPKGDNGEGLYDMTWEGGTNNLAHAVTQNRLVRKTDLIPQVYAFSMGTPSKYEDFTADLFGMDDDFYGSGTGMDVLASFMEHVQTLDGPVRAQSAVFDLSKAWDGACASVDQYGISANNLAEHGFDVNADDSEKDMKTFLKAVGEIIGTDQTNVLVENTMEGGMAKLTKRFHNSGQKLGKMMMEPVNDLMSVFTWLDKQDWNFMGITIPKGTLTQGIIAITGITSSIDPLIRTSNQLKNTFAKLTEGFNAFKNKIGSMGDSLRGIRDVGGLETLGQSKVNISNPHDLIRELGRTKSIENGTYKSNVTHGIFDYDSHLIDASENLTGWQKNILKNQRKSSSNIFDLYYGEDYVEAEAKRVLEKNKKYKEADWKTQQQMLGETRGKIRKSKENEINGKTFFQKLKLGAKGSFKGTRSAFKTGGLDGGLTKLTEGFRNLGGVFGGLLSAINPVTVILYTLMGVMTALGGIFLIAYANSEKFRNKLGELNEKLHELFDSLVFAIGDLLQGLGITESGGAEGISEFATQILDVLTNIVDYLRELVMAMTGRDLTQSKKTEELEGKLKNSITKLKNEEAEKGYGNASHKAYQDVVNQANQIKMWDPTYWTDDKMNEYAEKYGLNLKDDVYTDEKGVNFGRDILQADLDDPWFSETHPSDGPAWNYYSAEVIPRLEKSGIHVKEDALLNSLKTNGKWDDEKRSQLNKAIADDQLYIMSDGASGTKWNDNPFVKANPALHSEEKAGDAEKRDGGISAKILGGIIRLVDLLKVIGIIVGAILTVITIDKIAGHINKLAGLIRKNGWRGGISKFFKDGFKKKFPELSKLFKNFNLGKKLGNVGTKLGGIPGKLFEKLGNSSIGKAFGGLLNKFFGTNIGSRLLGGIQRILSGNTIGGLINRAFGSGIGQTILGGIQRVLFSGGLRSILSGGLRTLLSTATKFLPIIGQILMALEIAWTLTSWICDTLSGLGVPEWLLEMIFPLRTIQNHWEDIMNFIGKFFSDPIGALKDLFSGPFVEINPEVVSFFTKLWDTLTNSPLGSLFSGILGPLAAVSDLFNIVGGLQQLWTDLTTTVGNFCQTLKAGLEAIGLGFIVDWVQQLWDKLVGFYEWLKSLPIVGWLMPDGGTAENASEDMTNSTQELSKSSENVDSSNGNMWNAAQNALSFLNPWGTPFGTSTSSTNYQNNSAQPYTTPTGTSQWQTQQPVEQNVVNNDVHIDGGGMTAEELAKLVTQVLNEHVFWDAQKAGRTIDGTASGMVGNGGGLF